MNLIDKTKPVQGYFKITAITDKGSEIVYEDKNLIMDSARSNMAELVSGWEKGKPINKIIFGTKGYNPDTNNILEPIQVGTYGFDTDRTSLFSVEQDEYYFSISFDPYAPLGIDLVSNLDSEGEVITWQDVGGTGVLECYGKGNRKDSDGTEPEAENSACPIKIMVSDRTIGYTIELPELAGNGINASGTVAYTEASLMAGNDIFSMKTTVPFVKSNTVRFVIEWNILF